MVEMVVVITVEDAATAPTQASLLEAMESIPGITAAVVKTFTADPATEDATAVSAATGANVSTATTGANVSTATGAFIGSVVRLAVLEGIGISLAA